MDEELAAAGLPGYCSTCCLVAAGGQAVAAGRVEALADSVGAGAAADLAASVAAVTSAAAARAEVGELPLRSLRLGVSA